MGPVRALVASGACVVAIGGVGLVGAPAAGATSDTEVSTSVERPATVCVPVHAVGTGQDLGEGRTSATITVGRVVTGTTTASFTITGGSGSVLTFAGPIVLTNALGTITAPVTGTLDLATGDFVSTSSTVTGTGAYAGVTGTLTFTGHEDLSTGAFTETVTGSVCVPRGRR